jgi:hypothetical protein
MLPADQSTHSSGRSWHCFQPAAIPITPHEAFRVCRDELSVVVSELSILGEGTCKI